MPTRLGYYAFQSAVLVDKGWNVARRQSAVHTRATRCVDVQGDIFENLL
jgi:hypothetical protein